MWAVVSSIDKQLWKNKSYLALLLDLISAAPSARNIMKIKKLKKLAAQYYFIDVL